MGCVGDVSTQQLMSLPLVWNPTSAASLDFVWLARWVLAESVETLR